MFCAICQKEFKRPGSHLLRKHGLTLVDYYRLHEPAKAAKLALVEFLNNHYVTIRRRFLCHSEGETFTVSNRDWALNDADLMQHIEGEKVLGVYFPTDCSPVIGIDIDARDKELLNRIYSVVISYGVPDNALLMSFSGRKGYHLDIFLSEPLSKEIIRKFFNCLVLDAGITTEKKVELFGGNGKAYKLPLGYHYETKEFCYPCDEHGNELPTESVFSIEKISPKVIAEAVEFNFVDNPDADMQIAFADLCADVKPLPVYNEIAAKYRQQIDDLQANGVQEKGGRNRAIFLTAVYFKEELGFDADKCTSEITSWIANKWNQAIVDKETTDNVKHVIRSVYRKKWHLRKTTIALPEIREIFSVKTRNKLETFALRKLYYILLLHAKVFAKKDTGIFFMAYSQLAEAGAGKHRAAILRHVKKLEKMGKVQLVPSDAQKQNIGGNWLSPTNQYKLLLLQPCEQDGNLFTVCPDKDRCNDCFLKAAIYLMPEKERKVAISRWQYRDTEPCKYQKQLPFTGMGSVS
jgi:hypothetical protein